MDDGVAWTWWCGLTARGRRAAWGAGAARGASLSCAEYSESSVPLVAHLSPALVAARRAASSADRLQACWKDDGPQQDNAPGGLGVLMVAARQPRPAPPTALGSTPGPGLLYTAVMPCWMRPLGLPWRVTGPARERPVKGKAYAKTKAAARLAFAMPKPKAALQQHQASSIDG